MSALASKLLWSVYLCRAPDVVERRVQSHRLRMEIVSRMCPLFKDVGFVPVQDNAAVLDVLW